MTHMTRRSFLRSSAFAVAALRMPMRQTPPASAGPPDPMLIEDLVAAYRILAAGRRRWIRTRQRAAQPKPESFYHVALFGSGVGHRGGSVGVRPGRSPDRCERPRVVLGTIHPRRSL